MNVCARHREHPARIYGECIGCELEWLQEKIRALEESGEEDFRLSEAQSAALVELKRRNQILSEALATCFYYADGAKTFDGSAWRYEHWRLKKIAEVARECMEESVA